MPRVGEAASSFYSLPRAAFVVFRPREHEDLSSDGVSGDTARAGREAGTSAVIRRLQPSFTIACNIERSFILMAHTRPFPYLCAFLSQSVETICNAEPGPGPGYATLQPGTIGRGPTSMARLPSGAHWALW